jgi:hypothetical protein
MELPQDIGSNGLLEWGMYLSVENAEPSPGV